MKIHYEQSHNHITVPKYIIDRTFFDFGGGLIGVIKKIKFCLVVSIDFVGAETFSLQQRGYRFLR